MHDHLQFIAITFDDGSLGVMQFVLRPRGVPDDLPGFDPATGERAATDEAINYEIAKSAWQHKPVSWRRIAFEDIPQTREYRDAWEDSGREIRHSMVKAREIHRGKLRRQRAPILAQMDVAYQRADEQNDKSGKRSVALDKQRLRDITADPRIESAQSLEELRKITIV